MRLDELRRRSAESAEREAQALERHAPAAERDAQATRELAQAAGDLAAVQTGGFVATGSQAVVSAGGGDASGAASVGTGGGTGGEQGFSLGASYLVSQSGQGRQGGRILAEDWIGEHCSRTSFEVPNPRNTNALAEEDFVEVPGWDCSQALGVPEGTVVYYDPEAWEELQGVARLKKTSSGGGPRQGGGRSRRSYNITNTVGDSATRSTQGGPGFYTPPPPFTPQSSVLTSSRKSEDLLGELVRTQKDTLAELRKRPAGPAGLKGQRLV